MTAFFRHLRLLTAAACAALLAACDDGGSGSSAAPPAPVLSVTATPHALSFDWADELASPGTDYLLQYSTDGGTTFAGSVVARDSISVSPHLEDWSNTFVRLLACRGSACSHSNAVALAPLAIQTYAVINNRFPRSESGFGMRLSLSADGQTLAIAEAGNDARNTTAGDDCDAATPVNCLRNSGAVRIYTRSTSGWALQATLKASNASEGDYFGYSMALSASGDALVVGAPGEDGENGGIGVAPPVDACWGDAPAAPCVADSGAVYVFRRSGNTWVQRVFLKPDVTGAYDSFGVTAAISNGFGPLTVAVSAPDEDSGGFGTLGQPQADCLAPAPLNCRPGGGAVYVFYEGADQTWRQAAFLKQQRNEYSETPLPADDSIVQFGSLLSLSGDGKVLAAARGNSNEGFVATDVFRRTTAGWSVDTQFWMNGLFNTGASIALNNEGSRLAIGSPGYSNDGRVFVLDLPGNGYWDVIGEFGAPEGVEFTGFGWQLAFDGLGTRLLVGAPYHGGNGTGFGTHGFYSCAPADHSDCAQWSGIAHVFEQQDDDWVLRRSIKARSNELFFNAAATSTRELPSADRFGAALAISGDGSTLAIAAPNDDSGAAGIGGDGSDGCELSPASNCVPDSGTVYVY
jgi:hypothetical protein